MHRLTFLTLALVISAPFSVAREEPKELPGWKLIWNDEFDGRRVDSKKWKMTERNRADWGNYMSDNRDLYEVKDGILHLKGIVNENRKKDDVPYLTAGITTKGKFDFQYGKVVIRARVKSAQGAWPALWMLGSKGGWPANGEIDIMEHLNYDDHVYQTVHSVHTHKPGGSENPPKGGTAKIRKDEFNTYGVEWDKDLIVFTVNGKKTHKYPRKEQHGADQWPFDQKFYFILSMQIEGAWVGKAKPEDYPAGMEIDWIRVYQKNAH